MEIMHVDFQTFNTIPNVDESNNLVHYELQRITSKEEDSPNDINKSEHFLKKNIKLQNESVITIPTVP